MSKKSLATDVARRSGELMNSRLVVATILSAPLALLVSVAPGAGAVGYQHAAVVSANPVNYTPHVQDGTVKAIAVVGGRVYVGGTFTDVVNAGTSTHLARNYLFAFNRSTGRVVTTFAPRLDGAVQSLAAAPDGTSVVVGGNFRTVNGTAQRGVAMLAPDGSRVSTFTAQANGTVNKVLVRGKRLIVAGRFSTFKGASRGNLASMNLATGLVDGLNLPVTQGRTKANGTVTPASVYEMDANAEGSRLVVLGNFRRVGGALRQQIAMINLGSNSLDPWYTNRFPNDVSGTTNAFQCYDVFDTQMRDVEFAPSGSYFVVVTTGGAGDRNAKSLCDTTTRWTTTSTPGPVNAPVWTNCTGGDTLHSVAVTGAAVYVGGHQRWLDNCGGRDDAVAGSFPDSPGISAINPTTGKAIRTWHPGRTRGVGAEELVANADGLYIGSDTTSLGGEFHGRLGLFPVA
jgi:hypothetical protein